MWVLPVFGSPTWRYTSGGDPGSRTPGLVRITTRVIAVHEPFALMLPVFGGDRADFLEQAFRSSVDEQQLKPNQIVLVRDGPVGEGLARCLDHLRSTSPVPV